MITPSRKAPSTDAAATMGHDLHEGRRTGASADASSGTCFGFGAGFGFAGTIGSSVCLNSIRLSHATPSRFGFDGPRGAGAGGAPRVAGCAGADPPPTGWGDGAAAPTREISGLGLDPGFAPGLKNGTSACATSLGSWNLRSGSLAIILPTSAASSTGTSGRARFSGRAALE